MQWIGAFSQITGLGFRLIWGCKTWARFSWYLYWALYETGYERGVTFRVHDLNVQRRGIVF
jgi:hypothetical protein